jgi:hypothetical protein
MVRVKSQQLIQKVNCLLVTVPNAKLLPRDFLLVEGFWDIDTAT